MITIGVLTTTRADFGLLKTLIVKMSKDEKFDVKVLVTGTHLSKRYGETYKEIEKEGIEISESIEILSNEDSREGISKTMANALERFSKYFLNNPLDALIVLGDRYETLAVCLAAMNFNIPIFHLHGGEITEGAIDDAIRHSISKLSYLHFTSNSEYRKRVIQLGEDPSRVFDVGAIGVENALNLPLLSRDSLSAELGVDLNLPYFVVTFHPVTLGKESVESQFLELEKALDEFSSYNIIITKANADFGGEKINGMIDEYSSSRKNVYAYYSLGSIKYLSAVKYSSVVIGNSSSGIIEAPSFHVPTVNIGERQRGRVQANSIINCECSQNEIAAAIEQALSDDFRTYILNVSNPYENKNTTNKIISEIKKICETSISLDKSFYNVDFSI